MTKTWVIADTHFGHANILNFKREDGTPLRDFPSVEAMHETMIQNWNAVVAPEDRVYMLGDVAISRRGIRHIGRLTGRKVLVKGNHDIFKLKDYQPYFDDIRAYVTSPHQYILSHIPIHPSSMGRWLVNVHGHTHSVPSPDPRYVCVSVEQTNYTPVLLDTILKRVRNEDSSYRY